MKMNLIKVHAFTYLVALICIMTGHFKVFSTVMGVILFHELGHITGALIFKYKIKKIVILPFGGITVLEYFINKPLYQEFIITILGPVFQLVLFLLLRNKNIFNFDIINMYLLIFNLLPIIPLDGSKIINILLSCFFALKKTLFITIYISFIFITILCILLFYYHNFILIITLFFVFYKTIEEYKTIDFIFNKFIYERYLYKLSFKKIKKINNINKMMRDYKHIFYYNGLYYTEGEILKKHYKN